MRSRAPASLSPSINAPRARPCRAPVGGGDVGEERLDRFRARATDEERHLRPLAKFFLPRPSGWRERKSSISSAFPRRGPLRYSCQRAKSRAAGSLIRRGVRAVPERMHFPDIGLVGGAEVVGEERLQDRCIIERRRRRCDGRRERALQGVERCPSRPGLASGSGMSVRTCGGGAAAARTAAEHHRRLLPVGSGTSRLSAASSATLAADGVRDRVVDGFGQRRQVASLGRHQAPGCGKGQSRRFLEPSRRRRRGRPRGRSGDGRRPAAFIFARLGMPSPCAPGWRTWRVARTLARPTVPATATGGANDAQKRAMVRCALECVSSRRSVSGFDPAYAVRTSPEPGSRDEDGIVLCLN